ncbi:hypothetical protein [Pimelobacter simplex]|uniref:hypothetical protein n=1 Tax=Nocardioides simplex TaxID=2045 RepID=UPI001375B00C|nr:hypothetical protein [Pimelobacter simplex]
MSKPTTLDEAHEALRAEIAATSINNHHITGLLRAAEIIGVPDADATEATR